MTASAPGIASIAGEITGAWPQVVQAWEGFRRQYGLHLRADVGDTDRHGFLVEALATAREKDRLNELAALLVEQDLVTPAFASVVTPFCTRSYALQSIVNNAWRVQRVSAGVSGLLRARANVCRIAVAGRHRGTGVLIRPNLVATAAHVVEPLVDGDGRALPDALRRLVLHFSAPETDDEDEDAPPPIVARLHHDWLAHYSPPAPQENRGLSINSVDGIADEGPWDLAIIRLLGPPVEGMAGHVRIANDPDPPSFGVHLLHHPAGENAEATRMLWSIGQVREALGKEADGGTPRPLRWLHDANTSGGSSGAPCFDNGWKLVALHQAGPHRILDPDQRNRAVPIHGWVAAIDDWAAAAASVPFLDFVEDHTGRRVPVIGRRDLQTAAWRAMNRAGNGSGGNERVFVVRGATGLGKGFTAAIVGALGRLGRHAVASVEMRNALADDAPAFASRIAGALAAALPADRIAPSRLTSGLRDIGNDVAPALLAQLAAIAGDRQLWLVLNGWDDELLPPSSPLRQLVELLIAGIAAAPGLHLVLTGWTGSAPHYVETLAPPTAGDVAEHVLATMLPGGETIPPAIAQLVNANVTAMLALEPPGEPYPRAVAVAERLAAMMKGGG